MPHRSGREDAILGTQSPYHEQQLSIGATIAEITQGGVYVGQNGYFPMESGLYGYTLAKKCDLEPL